MRSVPALILLAAAVALLSAAAPAAGVPAGATVGVAQAHAAFGAPQLVDLSQATQAGQSLGFSNNATGGGAVVNGCPAGTHFPVLRTYILSLPRFSLTPAPEGSHMYDLRFPLEDAPAYMPFLVNHPGGTLDQGLLDTQRFLSDWAQIAASEPNGVTMPAVAVDRQCGSTASGDHSSTSGAPTKRNTKFLVLGGEDEMEGNGVPGNAMFLLHGPHKASAVVDLEGIRLEGRQAVLTVRWVDRPETVPEGSGCHSTQTTSFEDRHYHHQGACGYQLPKGSSGEGEVSAPPEVFLSGGGLGMTAFLKGWVFDHGGVNGDPIIAGFDGKVFDYHEVGDFNLLTDGDGWKVDATFVPAVPQPDDEFQPESPMTWTRALRVTSPTGDAVTCQLPAIRPNTTRITMTAVPAGTNSQPVELSFQNREIELGGMKATAEVAAGGDGELGLEGPHIKACQVATPKFTVRAYQFTGWEAVQQNLDNGHARSVLYYTWLNTDFDVAKPLTSPVTGLLGKTYPVRLAVPAGHDAWLRAMGDAEGQSTASVVGTKSRKLLAEVESAWEAVQQRGGLRAAVGARRG